MHGDRADSERRQPLAEGRQLGRRLRPSLPGGRVVDEDLERVRADRVCTLDSPDHPAPERRCAPSRRPSRRADARHGRRGQPLGAGAWARLRAAAGRVRPGDDRLDEPEVAVAAAVEEVQALVLGVDEDEERVVERLHLGDRVLLEHRLQGESLRLDHAPLAPASEVPSAIRAGSSFSSGARARTRGFCWWSTARRSTLSTTSLIAASHVEASARPRTVWPSMTSVTSANPRIVGGLVAFHR